MKKVYRISVRPGRQRYDVLIGRDHLASLGPVLRRLRLGTHPVLLTHPTLLKIHAGAVRRVLTQAGFRPQILTVADTEKSKSLETLGGVLKSLPDLDRPGRQLFLVLVGGGVMGDLGGLVAGLYKRGIPYIQVPTTLLSQVDSSIGGKTGVDLSQGKNLAGLFYQPRLVFSELRFLETLPDRQFRSGLAEVLKCGVIQDPAIFSFLEKARWSSLRRCGKDLAWLIARTVRVKASLVELDERETRGIRTYLNYGHTLGHAIEAATGYSRAYTHGEAIAVGMIVAAEISCRLRLISSAAVGRIEKLIRKIGLPAVIRGVKLERIFGAMSHDKKWSAASHCWVLPAGIGRAVVREGVPERIVRAAIQKRMEG